MLKFILCLVLVFVSFLVGNSFSQKITNRRKTLNAIVFAISRTKTLICFGGYDIQRVVCDSFCSDEFALLDKEILTESNMAFDLAFPYAVDKISSRFSLDSADKELLKQFGSHLGTTDVTGQISHTELYLELFSERLKNCKEQEITKSKLYKVLGFSFGCAISLMIC